MSTFEGGKEIRKAVERKRGAGLSDKEWEQLSSNLLLDLPYDDRDIEELANEAERLPSQRAPTSARKAQEFAADVQRLRRQLLAYRPEGDALTIQVNAADGVNALYQLVKGGAVAEAAAEVGMFPPAEIVSIHSKIGLAVHEYLAADWLARRYHVHWVTALNALSGAEDVAEIQLDGADKVEQALPMLSSRWVRAMRRLDNDPLIRPVIKDIKRALRIRQDRTKALLKYTLKWRGLQWRTWEEGRKLYERVAREVERSLSEEGLPSDLRHFWNEDSFRMAAARTRSREGS